MDNYTLWSLRLGFTGKHSAQIQQKGIRKFLDDSFASAYSNTMPQFLQSEPKTLKEMDAANKLRRAYTEEQRQEYAEDNLQKLMLIKAWWVEKMINDPYALREKITCLLHNHFVINGRKVRVPYWVYQHNALLREHALGNFRELTKLMVKSNAMISYLNNNTNRKGKINENLSRELLELFTLGIGNYKEQDIVQGAKALAGLTYGDAGGVYNAKDESNETITYLGKKGRFKADDIVNIIFEQPSAPYLFTRKVLQWFIYDSAPEDLVKYYGDYFRQKDFEIKPLLTKIFTEEFEKKTSGAKIKDPLVYILQLADEAGLKKPNPILVSNFIRSQGMDLYGQPNVKGWAGGYSWLTTQVYLARSKMADRFCMGYNFPVKPLAAYEKYNLGYSNEPDFKPEVKWKSSGPGNKAVINQLKERLLFDTDEALQKNFEQMLKYDFDPKSPNADEAVLRLFNYMVKTPEFQLI
jgi:uncharacterized protein (DUF1800 family)